MLLRQVHPLKNVLRQVYPLKNVLRQVHPLKNVLRQVHPLTYIKQPRELHNDVRVVRTCEVVALRVAVDVA